MSQVFDAYGEARAGDIATLAEAAPSSKCDPLTYKAQQGAQDGGAVQPVVNSGDVDGLRLTNAQLYDSMAILLLGIDEQFIAGTIQGLH